MEITRLIPWPWHASQQFADTAGFYGVPNLDSKSSVFGELAMKTQQAFSGIVHSLHEIVPFGKTLPEQLKMGNFTESADQALKKENLHTRRIGVELKTGVSHAIKTTSITDILALTLPRKPTC